MNTAYTYALGPCLINGVSMYPSYSTATNTYMYGTWIDSGIPGCPVYTSVSISPTPVGAEKTPAEVPTGLEPGPSGGEPSSPKDSGMFSQKPSPATVADAVADIFTDGDTLAIKLISELHLGEPKGHFEAKQRAALLSHYLCELYAHDQQAAVRVAVDRMRRVYDEHRHIFDRVELEPTLGAAIDAQDKETVVCLCRFLKEDSDQSLGHLSDAARGELFAFLAAGPGLMQEALGLQAVGPGEVVVSSAAVERLKAAMADFGAVAKATSES